MADATQPIVATANASQVKDTARNQLNQQIGKLVEENASSNADLIAAINSIATAINAKPSA